MELKQKWRMKRKLNWDDPPPQKQIIKVNRRWHNRGLKGTQSKVSVFITSVENQKQTKSMFSELCVDVSENLSCAIF